MRDCCVHSIRLGDIGCCGVRNFVDAEAGRHVPSGPEASTNLRIPAGVLSNSVIEHRFDYQIDLPLPSRICTFQASRICVTTAAGMGT